MGESVRDITSLRLDVCRIDGGTQARVGLDAATVDDYASALLFGATFPPIVVFFDGTHYWPGDGFHRLAAHTRAGRDQIDAEVRAGTQRDALLHAVGANNTHGLRRTNADKRRAVELLLADAEWRQWSDREIARRCGVNHEMVGSARSSLAESVSEPAERRYTTKHGTVATMNTANIGPRNLRGVPVDNGLKRCPTCDRTWAADLALCPYCTIAPEARLEFVEKERLKERESTGRLNLHFSSATPEHYTPQNIIDATLDCLGVIDLDPCSNEGPPNVPARKHFTAADDGLQQAWSGSVYMNPPYGREIDRWVEKLCEEHAAGHVLHAVALLPARTDTQWFRRLRDYWCCFIEGRLTFVGNEDPAPFPSVAVYLGDDESAFYHAFVGLGDIWQRVEPSMFGE